MSAQSNNSSRSAWPGWLGRGFGVAILVAAVAVGVASAGVLRSAVAPSNTTPPSISGSTSAGSTVTASPGSLERHGADQLRLSVGDLRPEWQLLPRHFRRDVADVPDQAGRQGQHAPRPGHGQQRRRLQGRHERRERRHRGRRAGEHRCADHHRLRRSGQHRHGAERQLVRRPAHRVRVSVGDLRPERELVPRHQRRDVAELPGSEGRCRQHVAGAGHGEKLGGLDSSDERPQCQDRQRPGRERLPVDEPGRIVRRRQRHQLAGAAPDLELRVFAADDLRQLQVVQGAGPCRRHLRPGRARRERLHAPRCRTTR